MWVLFSMYRPPRFKQSSKKATMLQSSTSNLIPPPSHKTYTATRYHAAVKHQQSPPPQGLHNCTRHHALLSSTSTFTPPRPIQSSIKASMKLSNTSPQPTRSTQPYNAPCLQSGAATPTLETHPWRPIPLCHEVPKPTRHQRHMQLSKLPCHCQVQ